MTQLKTRKIAAPNANVETQPFWDATTEGRLMIKRCLQCEQPHYYPRGLCPHCLSSETSWEESSGQGTIYSVSISRRGPDAPFALAYVTLTEGVSILTNIIDCDDEAVSIGKAVRFQPTPTEGGASVPTFTLA